MNNQISKTNYQEKIKKFSKIVHIVIKIVYICLIVALVLEIIAWLWLLFDQNADIVMMNGKEVRIPVLFKLGDFKVTLPVYDFGGAGLSSILGFADWFLENILFEEILNTIVTLVALAFAKKIFKILRESGSPFSEDVVKQFKKLAIALIVVGAFTGIIGFLAAGIVWTLCLIFDYGCALQKESDATL